MNPRTRRAAVYAIGLIAMLASANALAHSYAGLYEWPVHHRLTGWQARSWPAEIDVFLAVGEHAPALSPQREADEAPRCNLEALRQRIDFGDLLR